VAGRTIRAQAYEIEGLRSFLRSLRKIADDYGDVIKQANFEVGEAIVRGARERAAQQPGVARKAAESLRAARQASAAVVTGGGARYPYFFGAEFGARRYHQFQPWRGNQFEAAGWDGPGYFLHPTLREDGPGILRDYLEYLDQLHREAFDE
jgi:hypothetical protein